MKAGRRNTIRRLSRRGGKRAKTCRRYNGGAAVASAAPLAPGRVRLQAVNAAAAALNLALLDPAQRAIVKRRLQILYGTSETWKKLRNANNAAGFNNAAAFGGLPQNIKGLVQTLLDRITVVFNNPHSELEYNSIMLALIRNNLYHMTQEEYNDRNNFNDASTEYSNNGNSNSNNNNSGSSTPTANARHPSHNRNNHSNDPVSNAPMNNDPK